MTEETQAESGEDNQEDSGQPLENEEQMRAYVGEEKADYYLKHWRLQSTKMNWAAFFITGFWMIYRKMYAYAAIFFAIIMTESFLSEIIAVSVFGLETTPSAYDSAMNIAVAVTMGMMGNTMYRRHVEKQIAKEGTDLDRLKMLGGTNPLAAWVSLGIFILLIAGLVTLGMQLEESY